MSQASKQVTCLRNPHESAGSGPRNKEDEQRRALGLAYKPPSEDGDNSLKMLREAMRL